MINKYKNAILAGLLAIVAFGFVAAGGHIATTFAQSNAKTNYAPIPAGEYNIDPAHSIIGFAVRHLEINWVEGRFKDFKGSVNFDDKDVTRSTVQFTAQIASIDTGVERRNAHLRTADFFDAEKFPDMKFTSTKVEKRAKINTCSSAI